jgi:hypothetical protein
MFSSSELLGDWHKLKQKEQSYLSAWRLIMSQVCGKSPHHITLPQRYQKFQMLFTNIFKGRPLLLFVLMLQSLYLQAYVDFAVTLFFKHSVYSHTPTYLCTLCFWLSHFSFSSFDDDKSQNFLNCS